MLRWTSSSQLRTPNMQGDLPRPPDPFPSDVPVTAIAGIPLWRVWHPSPRTPTATQMRTWGPLARFDPHPPGDPADHPQHRVWYGAQRLDVAVLEVYNRDAPAQPPLQLTPPAEICRSARASLVTIVGDARVVDLTNPEHCTAIGASTELGSAVTGDYRVQQAWARILRTAPGVDGIRYPSARSAHVQGDATALLRARAVGTVTAQHLVIDDTLWPLVMMALDRAGVGWELVDRCNRC